MLLPDYNRQFLDTVKQSNTFFTNATKYGVQVKPIAQANTNVTQYWRVVGIHHLTGDENRGNHHAYCDVIDEDGRRINGARLVLNQDGQAPVYAVVDKPVNEAGTNFPLWSTSLANVSVQWPRDNPLPSEEVRGIRTEHADEEVGNTLGHHSFYVVFQRTPIKQAQGATATPTTTVTPPSSGTQTSPTTATPPSSGSQTPSTTVTPPPPPPVSQTPSGSQTSSASLENTIVQAGKPQIIPLNRGSALYKAAQQQSLGERLSGEYLVNYQGKAYLAQVYEKGIVYVAAGDWANIKVIPRTN